MTWFEGHATLRANSCSSTSTEPDVDLVTNQLQSHTACELNEFEIRHFLSSLQILSVSRMAGEGLSTLRFPRTDTSGWGWGGADEGKQAQTFGSVRKHCGEKHFQQNMSSINLTIFVLCNVLLSTIPYSKLKSSFCCDMKLCVNSVILDTGNCAYGLIPS